MELQILDLSHFANGSRSERVQFAKALVDGFTKHGFVKLINHGFSEIAVHQLFEMSKQFFDMTAEMKSRVANPPDPNPQRGWTGVGIETTSRLAEDKGMWVLSDTKEHFDQGPAEDLDFPNRWPEDPESLGFRSFMESCFELCHGCCMQVMSALEFGLQLPVDTLTNLCVPSASDLRLNHYPTLRVKDLKDGHTSRISPHTDFGVVSLLLQDAVGGLEIEDRGHPNSFIPVPPKLDEMIVNVSDTLQRWTNDVLKAGIHRVTVPNGMQDEGESLLKERFSMAYFFKAGRGVSVGPLEYFVDPQRPPRYQDMSALDFQKWRNQKMYAA